MNEGIEIVINPNLLVNSIIGGFTFLIVVCGSLIAVLGKILFNKLDKKIDKCSDDLTKVMNNKFISFDQKLNLIVEYNKETRKSVYHSLNRHSQHIEKPHANR